MGEIVNRTWEAAAQWQAQVVWIRMNVGFIKAEIAYIAGTGEKVADLERLVREFEPAFAVFNEEEMAVFTAARRLETELISRADFVGKVRALANCFQPWLEKFHAAVQARRDGDDHSLALGLLHGCGSEIMNAQRRFAAAVDAYAGELAS